MPERERRVDVEFCHRGASATDQVRLSMHGGATETEQDVRSTSPPVIRVASASNAKRAGMQDGRRVTDSGVQPPRCGDEYSVSGLPCGELRRRAAQPEPHSRRVQVWEQLVPPPPARKQILTQGAVKKVHERHARTACCRCRGDGGRQHAVGYDQRRVRAAHRYRHVLCNGATGNGRRNRLELILERQLLVRVTCGSISDHVEPGLGRRHVR